MRIHLRGWFVVFALLAVTDCGGNQTANQPTAPPQATASTDPEAAQRVLKPLPDNGFKADVTVGNPPSSLARGQKAELIVRVKNVSGAEWPMRGRVADGMFQINLGDHWFQTDRKEVKVDERAFLPKAVKPGEEVSIPFTLVAPNQAGNFNVEIDLVQEGVAWFREKGSQPVRLNITVQ